MHIHVTQFVFTVMEWEKRKQSKYNIEVQMHHVSENFYKIVSMFDGDFFENHFNFWKLVVAKCFKTYNFCKSTIFKSSCFKKI